MDKISDFSLKKSLSDYMAELSSNKNIIGAVLTGSAGREDGDAYSDVDIVVFVRDKSLPLREGKFKFDGQAFDVRICELETLKQMTWTSDMDFAYFNSTAIYDPEGLVQQLIKNKKDEWIASISSKIILHLVQLSVILEFNNDWKGLKADTHYQKFLSRQDYLSAHRTLNLGFEFVLDLYYLLKNEPPPDYKNKLRVFEKLIHPSDEILRDIKEFSRIGNTGLAEAERKYEILGILTAPIKEFVIKSDKQFPDNFYHFYLKNRI
jgi:predicted nucleotidyltransferase